METYMFLMRPKNYEARKCPRPDVSASRNVSKWKCRKPVCKQRCPLVCRAIVISDCVLL